MTVPTYDEIRLAAVLTTCVRCRRVWYMTHPQDVCIQCRRVRVDTARVSE